MLAGGMVQLQAAMLKQMSTDTGDRSPEAVKPGTTTLPFLAEPKPDTSPVDIMDWLELIATPLSDLSDGSAQWWRKVKKEATKSYELWANASPLEKLSIYPDGSEELEGGKWCRVNSRAASMVLLALPDAIKTEMVARRLTGSTVALIFRLMTLYQPGGESEKLKILQNLQSPPQDPDAQRTVEALRSWERWLRRCRELNVQAPDPSLLTRGLNHIVKLLMDKNGDAKFRTSLVKSTLGVDTSPTYDTVEKFFKHLMSECEALAVAGPTTSGTTTTTTSPSTPRGETRIKPVKTEAKPSAPHPPPPPRAPTVPTISDEDSEKSPGTRATTPCKFFAKTYKGCARTNKCPFLHSWEGLEKEKNGRCLACGGKGHGAKECPHKKPNGTPKAAAKAPHGQPAGQAQASSSSTSTATSNKNVRIDEVPQVSPIPARGEERSATNVPGEVDLKEVLADVGKMLKAMTTTSMKAFKVEDATTCTTIVQELCDKTEAAETIRVEAAQTTPQDQDRRGLLDSGASNALRSASTEEYDGGVPVKVTLAGEDTKILRQNLSGTVLVDDENDTVQPIVPMGAVIEELGYTLTWKKGLLRLFHPTKGAIRVSVNNRCPEISSKDALRLIREIENHQLKELKANVESLSARLEMLRREEERTWDELLREYVKTGCKATFLKMILSCPFTRDLPGDVQAKLAEGFDPEAGLRYLRELPLTRRKRKMLMNSNRWVVHLHPGSKIPGKDPIEAVSKEGKVLLEVDLKASKLWDIRRTEGVYRMLLWAASRGKIMDIIGSPPCETWPTSRAPRRGSELYPWRSLQQPYGLHGLQPLQQQKVDEETATTVKQMLLWFVSMAAGRGNVGYLMEFPSDEERLRECDPAKASFWNTELWKSFKSISGMRKVSFNMGAYGHKALRPTTLATNYPEVISVNNNYNFGSNCVPPSLLSVDELESWSNGFKEIVKGAIVGLRQKYGPSDDELTDLDASISKLTRQQKEEWTQHLLNDHLPYRADCSVCINAQANGYQHRRRKTPGLYSVALDLAGPFKQKGRDMEHDDYKYILVAAYRCPKEYLSLMSIPEHDRELYQPDEPTDDEDDPLALEEGHDSGPEEGDHPVSGEEEEKPLIGPETLDDAVEHLTSPPETTTIYLTRPLQRRTAPHVLTGAKEILMQLRQNGLHVDKLHTDRAREFKAKQFKEWTVEASLHHTKTAGGDPAGNSTAELGIKWAKRRVRALLRGAGADPKEWPMAISHASASMWSRAFPMSPWSTPPATTFGNPVWFRAKDYKGKKEKKHEAAGDRWKRGWYRGPASDVKRGHLIMRDDGGLTVAKSVKFNVVDPRHHDDLRHIVPPAEADGIHDEEEESELTPNRQQRIEEIEFISRKLLQARNFDLEEVVALYDRLESMGDTDFRVGKKTASTSWFSGAYVHGGRAGLRRNTVNFPFTTAYLVELGKAFNGGEKFSAVGIARNASLGLHRDSHNAKRSHNMVLPLTDFKQGNLWVQDPEATPEERVVRVLPNGKEIVGKMVNLKKGEITKFDPTKWHEVEPWDGDRVVLLMYTPRGTRMKSEDIDALERQGFPLDHESFNKPPVEEEDSSEEAKIRMINVPPDQEQPVAFIELDDVDVFPGGAYPQAEEEQQQLPPWTHRRTRVTATIRRMVKKAEVQYIPNIEAVLSELKKSGKQLEVTHTVSQKDVRCSIKEWKESAVKEFLNLKDSKEAFVLRKARDLPPGCRIVPCKGVYTVKPDKKPPGFRRKTRFVACGNHIPEGELSGMDFDLYAAGLDATSLRFMLVYASGKPWIIGITDIRQAFVLAPWTGAAVALKPPSLAVDLGLCSADDYWYVQKSIYGLRESPAIWSAFRDQQLREARWYSMLGGERVQLRLEQLVSDDQVWKIVRCDSGSAEPLGYLMVYIDDLMIASQSSVMESFFQWISNRWECDALDILTEDHPIKFLGMEIHQEADGYEISQEGYIKELLRAHGHNGKRSMSQGSRETLLLTEEEESALIGAEPVDLTGREREVKEAQRWVGEMLWLSGRTRPDIQHTVSIMSSRINRRPEMVMILGERLLDYLNETMFYRLKLSSQGNRPCLDVYTDSSFAPNAGKSQGASVVFFANSAITWRTGKQQLVTLSTAESEMLEAISGVILANSTKGLVEEVTEGDVEMNLLVDNMASLSLLTSASGTWRTRHLKLRSNWLRQQIQNGEVKASHKPGEDQRADLGTKPFTKDRLRKLCQLWNIHDRRNRAELPQANVRNLDVDPSWLTTLLLLCQWCGTRAQEEKETIKAEVPWDLYVVILVLATAIIGLWEGAKYCARSRSARLKALSLKAKRNQEQKLTRSELKELQRLLAVEPSTLTKDQKLRLVTLREKFDHTMPEGSSPTPRYYDDLFEPPFGGRGQPFQEQPASSSSMAPPITPTTTSKTNKQPRSVETKDASTQADYQPAFTRVEPPPPAAVRTFAGPFYQSSAGDRFHLYRECWGLRNAGRVNTIPLCRCCAENNGQRIY